MVRNLHKNAPNDARNYLIDKNVPYGPRNVLAGYLCSFVSPMEQSKCSACLGSLSFTLSCLPLRDNPRLIRPANYAARVYRHDPFPKSKKSQPWDLRSFCMAFSV